MRPVAAYQGLYPWASALSLGLVVRAFGNRRFLLQVLHTMSAVIVDAMARGNPQNVREIVERSINLFEEPQIAEVITNMGGWVRRS